MIIETSSTERNKEYKCFKELYLKRLDVSTNEIKEKFGMGNGKYTTMVKQVKEEEFKKVYFDSLNNKTVDVID